MLLTNIRRLCKERGISISKLEQATGIGNGTIGRWEKSNPSVDNAKKVADYFGVTVDSLLATNQAPDTEAT